MPVKLFGKHTILKLLAFASFISIFCALSLTIHVFRKDIKTTREAVVGLVETDKDKDGLESYHHPRNIFPALFKKQNQLKKEIKEFNQSLVKLSQGPSGKVSNELQKVAGNLEKIEMEAGKTGNDKNSIGGAGSEVIDREPPCYNVHAFYYPWYGNPEKDGKYIHWNHEYMRHWNKNEASKWKSGEHQPPDDIGANFYPLLGAYSSSDPAVVDQHMAMMQYAKIGNTGQLINLTLTDPKSSPGHIVLR